MGSFLTGFYLLNIFGRRCNLILADTLLIVGVLFMLLVGLKGFPQILGRFICGLSGGINCTIIPSYIAEMSPVKIRGEISSYYNTTLLIGIFASYLVSVGIPMEETLKTDVSSGFWRFLFFFPIIFAIFRIFMLFSYFKFEPALYLLANDREQEAFEVLSKIYTDENVGSVYLEYKIYLERYNSNMTYSELFSSKYRSRLFISIVLFMVQTFAGTNAVIYYSGILSGVPNGSEAGLKSFFILMSAVLAGGSYLSSKLVDKYGRKLLLLVGCGICMIQQFLIFYLISIFDDKNPNIFIATLSKIVILSFFFIYGCTLSPVCWILSAEILNDKGLSICGITVWASNSFLGFVFPFFAISDSLINVQGVFLIFGLVLLFGVFYVNKCVKETMGKTSEEIDDLYSDNNEVPLLANGVNQR